MNSHRELQRVEAFSDGVFAIACTLLILELKVPHVEDMGEPAALWSALKAVWPSFVAYILSFASILVAWAGHHRGVSLLVRSSKAFVYANGFLLLTITFMPFPTAVLAEYINSPQANIAVIFFSVAWLVANVGFHVWWLTMFWPVRLVSPSVSPAMVKTVTIQMLGGALLYTITSITSYWFPMIGLIVMFATQILWIVVSVGDNAIETA